MQKTSQRFTVTLSTLALLALTSLPVWAKPQINISIATAREITETRNGIKLVKLVPTQKASPGEVLHYTLTYVNNGNEPAVDAVIDNPIPKGTTFVANSATGQNSEITFSSDGGKTFAAPVKLMYEVRLQSGKVEKRVATPGEYTHIRWTIKQIPAGISGSVGFKVLVR